MNKLLTVGFFLVLALAVRAQDYAIVAHPGTTTAMITSEDVKDILLGNLTQWRKGPQVKLIVRTDGPVHEKILHDLTQRTPDQFEKFWIRRIFTGKGTMPAKAKSDAEVIAYVAANSGAFGYVEKSAVTGEIKVVEVQ